LAESPAHASDHTILDKLDSLGRSSQIDFAARGGGSNFREQVRQAVGLDDFTPGTAAGDALDVVAALLDALLGDVLISGDAKERIGQLAMPLLRTAFTEESFLASADHPAREVVDRIGRLDLQGSGPVAGTPAAVTVDALVGEIVSGTFVSQMCFRKSCPHSTKWWPARKRTTAKVSRSWWQRVRNKSRS